jgi:hypothetical protein
MPSSQHALMEATKKRAAKLEAKGKPVDFKELLCSAQLIQVLNSPRSGIWMGFSYQVAKVLFFAAGFRSIDHGQYARSPQHPYSKFRKG